MTTTVTHTVPVECSCRACKKYAARKGYALPMRALALPAAAERADASTLVHIAYDAVIAHSVVRPSIPVGTNA